MATASPASNVPSTARTPGGSRLLPRRSASRAPSSMTTAPRTGRPKASHRRREEEGPEGLAREEAREGAPVGPAGDHRGDARLGGDAGRLDLGGHPADPLERRRAPGGPDDGRVDPVPHGDEAGPARAARV